MVIGTVPYLNAVPLTYGLRNVGYTGEIRYGSPADLAQWLQEGQLTAGLIPIAEYLRGVGAVIVKGVVLASDGPVRSVLVVSDIPLAQLRTVAVDRGSRTSVLLMKIVLAERYGVYPVLFPSEPDPDRMLEKADACLLIGDAALRLKRKSTWLVTDLGGEWKEMTGLPFVFAAWVLASEADPVTLPDLLRRSCVEGLSNLHAIAREEASRRSLDFDLVFDYLARRVQYQMTERHLESIRLFSEKCRKHGFIGDAHPISLTS